MGFYWISSICVYGIFHSIVWNIWRRSSSDLTSKFHIVKIDTKCTGTTRNFLHCLHSSRYVSVNRIIECSWLFNRKGYLRENFEIPLKLVSFAFFFEMQVAKIANGYGWHHDCDALRLFEYIGGKSLHRTRLFGKLILIHRIRHHLQFTQ